METPTHYAARYGSAREVETLLLCLTRVFGDLEELVELGAANPLNVGDGDGMTSLYVAGTADDNSSEQVQVHDGPDESTGAGRTVEVRDAKVRLLINHGGCLFRPEFLAEVLVLPNSRSFALPAEIKFCLGRWLLESYREFEDEPPDVEDCRTAVANDLFVQWLAHAACVGDSLTVLTIVALACPTARPNLSPPKERLTGPRSRAARRDDHAAARMWPASARRALSLRCCDLRVEVDRLQTSQNMSSGCGYDLPRAPA
ncbi:hypothetical protein ON010_g14190 [Phytophthora cinnamomi]|nr:hypothetical protein ON010_g14190 [Phytophthora cinnamomi]